MKKSFINSEFIEGRLYQHNLVVKVVKNEQSDNFGKEFISGTIDIATDEEGLNVIPVHFTYVTEMTKGGNVNATFTSLKNIINGARTWVTDGKDMALKIRCNTALGLNDFYNNNNELVSAKRNEGGFVSTVKDLVPEPERSRFDCDMIITSVTRVEADDYSDDYLKIKGGVFDFRKSLLPVEFICRKESGGMDYFESLDASPSNPVFTEVKGDIINNTVTKEIEEASAFGAASVKTVTRTAREWQITWARPVEYDFGEEDTITAEELKQAMQDRQVYLANLKKNRDEYMANRAKSNEMPASAMNVPEGGFDF